MIRDGHASGINSADEDDWSELATRMAEACDVFSATERRRDLVPAGWSGYRPRGIGGGLEECPIDWNPEVFGLAGPRSDTTGFAYLTRRSFKTVSGVREGLGASWVLLRHHEEKWTYLRLAFHLPAKVQQGDRFRLSEIQRVRAWRQAVRRIAPVVSELRHDLRPDEVTAAADWNVNLLDVDWQSWVNRELKGSRLRIKPPSGATMPAGRGVDAHASSMRRVPSGVTAVLPRQRPFDHNAIVSTFARRKEK